MGEYLFEQTTQKIGKLDGVKEVRGIGLMLGVEISANIAEVLSTLRSKGLIALPAGENVIRLLPPLNITKAEVDQAVDLLEKTLSHITSATV